MQYSFKICSNKRLAYRRVAQLADALDLGSSVYGFESPHADHLTFQEIFDIIYNVRHEQQSFTRNSAIFRIKFCSALVLSGCSAAW